MKQIEDCHLYTFIDEAYLHGETPAQIAKALIAGGSDIIQLRFKHASFDELLHIAQSVLPLTQAANIPLVINDYADIAESAGAEYLHLGQEDFFQTGHTHVQELSAGKKFQIGLSSHAPQQALQAAAAGAIYLGVGPVFPTQTKPQAHPVTLDYVRWAATHLSIPWFAIGGINLTNLKAVLAAGARGICVVSDILNAPDITEQCLKYRAILDKNIFSKKENKN